MIEEPPLPQVDDRVRQLHASFLNGAGWFWWIAGLSVVNSIAAHLGLGIGFLFGLGVTQVVDAVVPLPVAIAVDAAAAGVFFAFGWMARRRHTWAFIVGATLYVLDGLIMVPLQLWFAAAFHVFALVGIFGGMRAHFQLRRMALSE